MNQIPASVAVPGDAPAFPLRRILPWAAFGLVLCAAFVYFAGAEQGATALFAGDALHELMHDGRHLLGFPCH